MLVQAYNKVERHLEEIYLLREDSERFKKHLIEYAAYLENYCDNMETSHFPLPLDNDLIYVLKTQINRRLSEYYNLYNHHSLPNVVSYVPPKQTVLHDSLSVAMKEFREEMRVSKELEGLSLGEQTESIVPSETTRVTFAENIKRHEYGSMPTPPPSEGMSTPGNTAAVDPILIDDEVVVSTVSSYDTWRRQLLPHDEWLSTDTMYDAFRLMHRITNDPLILPPRFNVESVLIRDQSKMKLINYVFHNQNHWICILCTRSPNTCTLYNSLHGGKPTKLSPENMMGLKAFFANEDFTIYEDFSIQQQTDWYNCGMFAIMFGQCLFRGENPADYTFDVSAMRNHLFSGLVHDHLPVFPRVRNT